MNNFRDHAKYVFIDGIHEDELMMINAEHIIMRLDELSTDTEGQKTKEHLLKVEKLVMELEMFITEYDLLANQIFIQDATQSLVTHKAFLATKETLQ